MAYPPHKTLASVPVSQTIALKFLSSYLAATKTTPYLIPNARLEPTGPTAGSTGVPVQLHNLERVEAGLRGEYLAPVLELGDGEDGGKVEAEDDQEAPEAKKVKTMHEGGLNGAKSNKEVDKKARKAAKKERAKEEKKRKQADNLKRKAAEE